METSNLSHFGPVSLGSKGSQLCHSVIKVMAEQQLDYDDAYQYLVADQYTLTLVSFDTDFDHTARGRQTPAAILQQLRQSREYPS